MSIGTMQPADGPRPRVLLGARWDEPRQNSRICAAYERGLIDYAEVNFPLMPGSTADLADTPVFVHCPVNPVASPYGFNRRLAEILKRAAVTHGSPWVGEHLCWTGEGEEGRLGYIITPPLCNELVEIAAANVADLQVLYGRPVALELAPLYHQAGDFGDEMEFLGRVAVSANALIILDVAHWTVSNRNLGRPLDHGLDRLPPERIVELHVAGVRRASSSPFWHDSHGDIPEPAIVELALHLTRTLPRVRALTFEHADTAPQTDFWSTLELLRHEMTSL
jgi:uncharacterized protein (UPF0276 family)